MPHREFRRDQVFLLPPSLDDFLPADHPARFVAEFVEDRLSELDIDSLPAAEGRPSYPPALLLCCWLYGFMTKVRSSRALERACTENVAFMWLTGLERPDHNTLWRFYKRYRQAMRPLFQQTVHLAIRMNLVDFALQAVDGTKIAAAAADRRTLRRPALAALREQVETEITALEAENAAEEHDAHGPSWRLPEGLTDRKRLRKQIDAATKQLEAEAARTTVNLTDPDAGTMKGAHGFLTGYNAQAVADSKTGILVGLEVMTNAADQVQLVPMLAEVQATAERLPTELVADTGYYSGANLAAAAGQGVSFFTPVRPPSNPTQDPAWRYHRSHFRYDPLTDTYTCPEDKPLVRVATWYVDDQPLHRYRGQVCDDCPMRAACTQNIRGRELLRHPWDDAVLAHRDRMATAMATARLRVRRQLIEPVFGIIKEQLGLRRFLLRGREGVRAEWLLTGAAYNLRKLYRYGWQPRVQGTLGCPA